MPPHVHPAAWGMAVAGAALMGALAAWTPGPTAMPGVGLVRGAVCLWVVVAASLAINAASAYQLLASARTVAMWASYLFVFLYGARLAGTQAERTRAIVPWAVIVAGTGLAAHGLFQSFYGLDHLAQSAAEPMPEALRARIASGRAVATLGLPGALAGFLALSLPLTLWEALERGAGASRRVIAVALALIQAAGLLATRSAAGLACAALALAWGAWGGWGGSDRVGARRARRLAAAIVVAGLLGAAALFGWRLASSTAGDEGSGPIALRWGNWKVAMAILAEHPLYGAGAGCYGIAFPAHREWGMNESRHAHNSFLQVAAEGGLFLGVISVVMAVALVRALRHNRKGIEVACLAFLLHNLFDFTFYLPSVALVFFCLAGVAIGGRASSAAKAPQPGLRLSLIPLALAAAAFALVVTRGDMAKQRARDMAVTDRSVARTAAGNAVAFNPIDPDSRSLLSHLLLDEAIGSRRTGLLMKAEAEALRAVELDPRTPHHWSHLGRVRLARGDVQGAYVALHRAAQLYPINVRYREDRDAVASALRKAGGAS